MNKKKALSLISIQGHQYLNEILGEVGRQLHESEMQADISTLRNRNDAANGSYHSCLLCKDKSNHTYARCFVAIV